MWQDIESLRRNVTTNLPTWLAGVFSFREYRTENKIVVSAAGRSNNFYLFGGRDESSASPHPGHHPGGRPAG